ncbi:MAG: sel1 repeat family protein [Alphaproteobacteria bacterium]|nr:sel1 repeat family protein [Alphaproteobacteria bacterium]
MKKAALILLLLSFSSVCFAQNIDLASAIAPNEEFEKQIETDDNDEKVADDRGIFSFLNFSFIKKHTSSKTDNEDELMQAKDDSNSESAANEPIKPETPIERMERLANGGKLDAQLNLGYMYLYGQDGVQTDYQKAFHFYELAANQNNPIALNNLGSLYFNGIGTKVNYQKAAELFFRAAQQGSDDAAVNLAFIYLSSENTDGQHEDAINMFKDAANMGNNTAKFMLGYAYYKGFIVEQDFHKAVALIKDAANAKFDIAQYMLAVMYRNGQGIAKNYGNAVKNYRLAVSQGNVPAMMELGEVFAKGTIYPKNEYMAHILFNIASVYNAKGADVLRDEVEKLIKIEQLLEAQTTAENYKENPSELTLYIRQTYGNDVRIYIDENIKKQNRGTNGYPQQ